MPTQKPKSNPAPIIKTGTKIFLRLFKIDQERQQKVYDQLKEGSEGDLDFYTLSIFSAIIISLGLIIDNGPVVIGGMLVAPLVWPLLGLGISIVEGKKIFLWNALTVLAKAMLLILFFSFLIGLLIPAQTLGDQILMRTQPSIFELLIALAAGFIGAFIIGYPKIGSAIGGVAIAVAIVPPICVMGVTIAKGDLNQTAGAFLLVITNLIAIILASSLFFILANFKPPASKEAQTRRRSGIIWTTIILIIITVTLGYLTQDIIRNDKLKENVNQILRNNIDQVEIINNQIKNKDGVLYIETVIRTSNYLTEQNVKILSQILASELDQSVDLSLSIIPTQLLHESSSIINNHFSN
ncbi:MAG: DUF389 domain-containing protein [Patescibacteria group bacterium]|nr:DUF389 domain-containing protein [Patescibacteria group bacterium]